MLYVGHFSFNYKSGQKKGAKMLDGYFTALAEADSAEDAAGKFRKLIKKKQVHDELFGDATDVFLEGLVEVKKMPAGGFVSNYVAGYPEGIETVLTFLRGAAVANFNLYTSEPEGVEGGEYEIEPFLTLAGKK